ncbi:DeoR/GlpR transcriptional regulator [Sporolactobacillus sp. THM7-7]|nr:DeoR/GlpR transcriptional regulator [Sporolactobacillus sp. THM7-7]
MLAIERRKKIIDMIHKEKHIMVTSLSERFHVSEETIRRDLEKLEKSGIVTRTYGGAVLNRQINEDLPFTTRKEMNKELKQDIAVKANPLIKDGDTIMADPSSTVCEFLRFLNNKKNLTIITNSIKYLYEFVHTKHHFISTGGDLRFRSYSLTGSIARETVNKYNVDVAIFSCKGLSMSHGITDSNEPESDLKTVMVKQAAKILLLVDHSKFDKVAFVKQFEFKDVDYVVTDRKPSAEWLNFFKKQGITVIY